MRFLRAFAAAAGASGSIIAAGGIILAVLSAGMAFHAWPGVDAPSGRVTELAAGPGQAPARAALRVAATTTLPAVPVRRSPTTRAARHAPRHLAAERRSQARRERGRGHFGAPALKTPRTPPSPTAGGTAPSRPEPSSAGGTSPSSAGASAPSSVAATPAAPRTPSAPALPSTPAPSLPAPAQAVTDAAGQAVAGTTQAAGAAVGGVTSAAAGALQPVAPAAATTVAGVGAAVDQTVTGAGQVVDGVLSGLGGQHTQK